VATLLLQKPPWMRGSIASAVYRWNSTMAHASIRLGLRPCQEMQRVRPLASLLRAACHVAASHLVVSPRWEDLTFSHRSSEIKGQMVLPVLAMKRRSVPQVPPCARPALRLLPRHAAPRLGRPWELPVQTPPLQGRVWFHPSPHIKNLRMRHHQSRPPELLMEIEVSPLQQLQPRRQNMPL